MSLSPAHRLIVALDTPDVPGARALAARLGDVGVLKIGMGLFFQPGAEGLIDELIGAGRRVFLDAKSYDIGDTVRRAVASAARRGVHMMTVHGDPDVLNAAAEGRGGAPMKLLAVSVLTSLDDTAVRAQGYAVSLSELVDMRVRAAVAAGVDGFIASASDAPADIKHRCGAQALLAVTPGIRPAGTPANDQKRTATPAEAIAAGADYIVVGRPITAAADPASAALAIIEEMSATSGPA